MTGLWYNLSSTENRTFKLYGKLLTQRASLILGLVGPPIQLGSPSVGQQTRENNSSVPIFQLPREDTILPRLESLPNSSIYEDRTSVWDFTIAGMHH